VRDVPDLTLAPGAPALAPGQSLSGLLLPSLGEIWVNEWEGRQWPGRRRFTIGHEVGHWVMHAPGAGGIFCRSQTVQPEEGVWAIPPIEEEAQVFSAALLMPIHLIDVLQGERPNVDDLCARFGVTKKAMNRRLRDMDLI
jgi:Zn-dependent peptidase ImmA (M78 family)